MRHSRFSIILPFFLIVFGINQIGENSIGSTLFSGKMLIPNNGVNNQFFPLVNDDQQITTQCAEISTSGLVDSQGKLLIGEPDSLGEIFKMELEKGEITPFFADRTTRARSFTVSPDGQWLAYQTWQPEDFLVVKAINGNKVYTFPWDYDGPKTNASLIGWLNNEQLVIWYFDSEKSNGVTLFNPFSNSKTKKTTVFPDVTDRIWNWQYWPSVTIFDPTLRYVAYISDKVDDGSIQNLVLWDIQNSKRLVTLEDFGLTHSEPVWKKDGGGLYVVKSNYKGDGSIENDELFYMGLDGTVKQLTYLEETFPGKGVIINSPTLSPDEKKLVMTIEIRDPSTLEWENRLIIYDLTSLVGWDTCIRTEKDWVFEHKRWSPDGTRFAYLKRDRMDKNRELWVVDLDEKKAKLITKDADVFLWLK